MPKIALSVSGRSVALSFSHKEFYEFSGYAVQISKDGKTWYSYGEDDYERDNENKWQGKTDEATQISGSYKAFFLSLEGETQNMPANTIYYFRGITYGATDGNVKKSSEWTEKNLVIATATLARDIVANAITNNKLAEGAVTREKIAAGTITADELYAGDLAAGGASFGKITSGGNGISGDANNFWDLEKNEFRVGNDINLENTETGLPKADNNDAWYFHYKQSFGLALSLAKFVVTSIASIIKGVFKIQTNSGEDFVKVNPESTKQSDIAAKTFNVDGTINATNVTATAALKGNSVTATNKVSATTIIADKVDANNSITTANVFSNRITTINIKADNSITATNEVRAKTITADDSITATNAVRAKTITADDSITASEFKVGNNQQSIEYRSKSFNGFKMHEVQANALYIEGREATTGDSGGLAITNDSVTVFGAGDTNGVFRVVNEDNAGNGSATAPSIFNIFKNGQVTMTNRLTVPSATIGGRPAITSTTSTDSNGILILNLYTN